MSTNEQFHHGPEQTELEKALNRGFEKIEPYTNYILVAFLALTVVLAGAIIWYRNNGMQQSAGWEEFSEARAPDDYLAIAEKYPQSPVGHWARLEAAKQFLAEGLMQSLTNREVSDERLNKAKDAYNHLLNAKVSDRIREEALYGMATCLEALADGDLQPAISAYETLLQEFPDSRHEGWVKERIESLKAKGANQFYAWFRKQNPKPSDRPQPQDIPNVPPESTLPDLQMPLGNPSDSEAQGKETSGNAPPAPAMPKPLGETPKDFPEGAAPKTENGAKAPEMPAPAKPAPDEKPTNEDSQKPADKPAAEKKTSQPEAPAPKADAEKPQPAPASDDNS